MLVTNQLIELKINNMNYKWFTDKGYVCAYGELIKVKAEDLQPKSNKTIDVYCDYCMERGIENILPKKYNKYYLNHQEGKSQKDCCKQCSIIYKNKELAQARKLSYKQIEYTFLQYKCILISDYSEYENNESLLKFVCIKHFKDGVQRISYGNLTKNKGCKLCGRKRIGDKLKCLKEDVFSAFNDMGFIIDEEKEEYIDAKTPIKCKCINHLNVVQHKTYDAIKQGVGCRLCFNESIQGENHYNWKGGVSPLNSHLRRVIYKWVIDSLKQYNYTCVISGCKGALEVHHTYPFHKIVEETIELINIPIYQDMTQYSQEEYELISKTIIKLHNKYGYGVPLNPKIHKLFHAIYGKENNTFEQFLEFTQRYNTGEFSYLILAK